MIALFCIGFVTGAALFWWTRRRRAAAMAKEEATIRRMLLDSAMRLAAETHRAAAAMIMLRQLRESQLDARSTSFLKPEVEALEHQLAQVQRECRDAAAEQKRLAAPIEGVVRKWQSLRASEGRRAGAYGLTSVVRQA
jgi:hypothetical protein